MSKRNGKNLDQFIPPKRISFYEKPLKLMNTGERAVLQATLDELLKGVRMYGSFPDDLAHLRWALGLVALRLKEGVQKDHLTGAAVYFELCYDASGYGIRLIVPESPPQPEAVDVSGDAPQTEPSPTPHEPE